MKTTFSFRDWIKRGKIDKIDENSLREWCKVRVQRICNLYMNSEYYDTLVPVPDERVLLRMHE
jgi:hypothetical protein